MAEEKALVETTSVPVDSTAAPATAPSVDWQAVDETGINEKPSLVNSSSIEDQDEPEPHLHAKTWLTVFAVCLIYFAQLINVVGAGAVSLSSCLKSRTSRTTL